MISGASGGAIAAAYFGYKGRDGYQDFRERFLTQNARPRLGNGTSARPAASVVASLNSSGLQDTRVRTRAPSIGRPAASAEV